MKPIHELSHADHLFSEGPARNTSRESQPEVLNLQRQLKLFGVSREVDTVYGPTATILLRSPIVTHPTSSPSPSSLILPYLWLAKKRSESSARTCDTDSRLTCLDVATTSVRILPLDACAMTSVTVFRNSTHIVRY